MILINWNVHIYLKSREHCKMEALHFMCSKFHWRCKLKNENFVFRPKPATITWNCIQWWVHRGTSHFHYHGSNNLLYRIIWSLHILRNFIFATITFVSPSRTCKSIKFIGSRSLITLHIQYIYTIVSIFRDMLQVKKQCLEFKSDW